MNEFEIVKPIEYVTLQDLMKLSNRSRTAINNKLNELGIEEHCKRDGSKKLIPSGFIMPLINSFSDRNLKDSETDLFSAALADSMDKLISLSHSQTETIQKLNHEIERLQSDLKELKKQRSGLAEDMIKELNNRLSEANSIAMQATLNQSKNGLFKRIFHKD